MKTVDIAVLLCVLHSYTTTDALKITFNTATNPVFSPRIKGHIRVMSKPKQLYHTGSVLVTSKMTHRRPKTMFSRLEVWACFTAVMTLSKCTGHNVKQGKSEGFESCDRPIVRKRPIWVKIGDVFSCVTLKFDGWPWKTIGHLSFAVSSFVQHFIAIGEFKLELLSGNAHFGSNSTIFRAVWPCNLTYDLEKQ